MCTSTIIVVLCVPRSTFLVRSVEILQVTVQNACLRHHIDCFRWKRVLRFGLVSFHTRPQQRRSEHGCQIVKGHFVLVLMFVDPEIFLINWRISHLATHLIKCSKMDLIMIWFSWGSFEKHSFSSSILRVKLPLLWLKASDREGYNWSVKRASGSSRKYNFKMPVTEWISTSLSSCSASYESARESVSRDLKEHAKKY